MPLYTFSCPACKTQVDKQLKISEREGPTELPCETCGGKISRIITAAPRIVSGVEVKDKRPDGWKDVLKNIKKQSGRTSNIDV